MEHVVGRDSDVVAFEQSVDVTAEQKTVIDAVWATVAVGRDVCSFQSRDRVLDGDGARARVGVAHRETERPLPEPWPHIHRRPVPGFAIRRTVDVPCV